MAAQYVGLALVVLLAGPTGDAGRMRRPARAAKDFLVAAALAYLWLAGTRSVGLALAAAIVVLVLAGRPTAARLPRMGAEAGLLAWFVLALAPTPAESLEPSARESKRASAEWRLAVWSDTLDLIRDHPLGVGAGNFEHAFIPYALTDRSRPGEVTVFHSPHNDYLRLVAEEGIGGSLLSCWPPAGRSYWSRLSSCSRSSWRFRRFWPPSCWGWPWPAPKRLPTRRRRPRSGHREPGSGARVTPRACSSRWGLVPVWPGWQPRNDSLRAPVGTWRRVRPRSTTARGLRRSRVASQQGRRARDRAT